MTIEYKKIELTVDTTKFRNKKICAIIYYEGKNVTEIFEKLELTDEINELLNK